MAGLFGNLFGPLLAPPQRKDALTLDQMPGFLMGPESKTGLSVTWSSALQVSAMLACCRVVGEGLATARCRLLQRRPNGGFDEAANHPLHSLLWLQPEKDKTAFGFWETMAFHVMLVGNAFVFVNRVGSGRIFELVLLEPGRVTVTKMPDRSLRYSVVDDVGGQRDMPAGSIWHVRGPSWNGWMGMETVRLAREALGLSLALEESHADLHKGGIRPSGFYSMEGELTTEQFAQLSAWLKRFAAAGDLANSPLILDRDAKWLNQQMTGVDLQHLETRRFQIEEVCRAVGVMPIMVGLADKVATYSSSEQMFLAHGKFTMTPWAGRIEQSVEVALLTEEERASGLVARFDLSVFMRGDYKSRQEGLLIQRRAGVINANEWREVEGMNPRDDPGGNQFIVESNMAIQDGRDLNASAPAVPTPKVPTT